MNNIFNLKRFGLLIKRHWLEMGKIHLISFAILAGIIASFYAFTYFTFQTPVPTSRELAFSFREPLFFILGILFISIAASQHFAPLGQKPKAIIELTLPASTFEKFLVALVFAVILALISYLFIFWVIDFAFVTKLRNDFNMVVKESMTVDGLTKTSINAYPIYFFEKYPFKEIPKVIYVLPFIISSIFLLGSIYFNKYHYLKTILTWIVFSSIWGIVISKSATLIFDNLERIPTNRLFNDEKNLFTGILILLTVLTLIFWAITFVRLKEKEV